MSETRIIESFQFFIESQGIPLPPEIVPDGRIHRYSGDRKDVKKSCGYVLHVDHSPRGMVWDFRTGGPDGRMIWRPEAEGMATGQTPHGYAQARRERIAAEKAEAAPVIAALWESAPPASEDHPYLVDHGRAVADLLAPILRLDRQGGLLVPYSDPKSPSETIGLQHIATNGKKWYEKGSRQSGASFRIPGTTERIYICEGAATGAAVHIATGGAVWCGGSSGQLTATAQAARAAYPEACIVIAGDHDFKTPGNPGKTKAEAAAAAVGGTAIIPEDIPDFWGSDWCDVLAAYGIDTVRARLIPPAEAPAPEPAPAESEAAEATAEGEDLQYTDMGNSQRFAREFGGNIRYCHSWKSWLIWDGRRWKRDEAGEIYELARQVRALIAAEAARYMEQAARPNLTKSEWAHWQGKAKEAWKGVKSSESLKNVKAFLEFAQSEPGIAVSAEDLDADLDTLNVANGIVYLRTGKLLPHDPGKYCSKLIDIPYDPAAIAARWEKAVLDFANGDAELAFFLQRAVGYSLTGRTLEQCIFILQGRGRNGKSLFLKIVKKMAGEYAKQADFSLFAEKEQERISNDIARLCGARFVSASEGEQGKRLAEAAIKHMTGGEAMVARFLRKEFFEFMPQFSPWLATNHKPQIRGTDEGIWRRIRLIPCRAYFDPADDDPSLDADLDAEMPGILAWAVQGAVQWYRQGLGMAEVIRQATAEFREEMDSIGAWLAECCATDNPRAVTPAAAIYASYAAWAEAVGEGVLSRKSLGIRLGERGFTPGDRTGSGHNTWCGISVIRTP